MKNYYYFLGIDEDASDEDIRKAYRKLSLKYHPDKNPDDNFFSDRFKETQEAYEILIDADLRKIYDANFREYRKTFRSHLPPLIKTFTADKIRVKKGDAITIKWNTLNADVVKIMPFGLEKPYGERIFKITEFQEGKFQLLLYAYNSLLRKTAVQGIIITEVSENDAEQFREEVEQLFKPHQKNPQKPSKSFRFTLLILVFFIIFIALLIIFNEL